MRTFSAPLSYELPPLESGPETDDPTGDSGGGAEGPAPVALTRRANRSSLGSSSSYKGALGPSKVHRGRRDGGSHEMFHFDYSPL